MSNVNSADRRQHNTPEAMMIAALYLAHYKMMTERKIEEALSTQAASNANKQMN